MAAAEIVVGVVNAPGELESTADVGRWVCSLAKRVEENAGDVVVTTMNWLQVLLSQGEVGTAVERQFGGKRAISGP
jgi:hypothetical protein